MIEFVIFSALGSGVIATMITATAQFLIVRGNKKYADQRQLEARRELSPEMRDEIEQNEAWWLRSYHALMLRSGAKVIGRIHGLEIVEKKELPRGVGMKHGVGYVNVSYQQPDRVALEGCICRECAEVRVVSEGIERHKAEMDRRVAKARAEEVRKARYIGEIQSNMGMVPTGVMDPLTLRRIRMGVGTPSELSPSAYEMVTKVRRDYEALAMPSNVTSISRRGMTLSTLNPPATPVYARGGYVPQETDPWSLVVEQA